MRQKREISAARRLTTICDRVGIETCVSNDDAQFLLSALDQALMVNAALILERHKVAEEIAEEQANATLRRV